MKIFSLKQSLSRYKHMNNSMVNNTSRSITPIISREFDQSINNIKNLKQTLPDIRNTLIENKLPNIKTTKSFAKEIKDSVKVASEIMERARTEKILSKYAKRY